VYPGLIKGLVKKGGAEIIKWNEYIMNNSLNKKRNRQNKSYNMILRRNKIAIMGGCYRGQRKEGPNEKRPQNETPA
jgi:hypothetical protein